MEKAKNFSVWTELGYDLFAHEGLEGIQVERLARILQLNKSGFYHYFGDLEGYYEELVALHKKKVSLFLQDVSVTKNLDPGYLQLLIVHAQTVMFQVQITRYKDNYLFYHESENVDRRVNHGVRQLWCEYVDILNNEDVAMRYYDLVRDMLYTRVTFKNLNYPFLHSLVSETKFLIHDIARRLAVIEA